MPARLHLGFLDLNGELGRRFGSLGIALDGLGTQLHAARAERTAARGPEAARAADYARRTLEHLGVGEGVFVEIEDAIPAHNGLGSGTQLALAVGTAVCRLLGRDLTAREIAQVLDRGARSGIGIGAFEQGGVLLDGGRGASGALPPPIVSRLPFPEAWRILLIFDRDRDGLHGEAEIEAFRRLPAFPAAEAARLCRLVIMSALPALAERDLATFGAAVTELQRSTGDHFAAAQGGRYASPAVAEVLAWLEDEDVAVVGQSSWGPTGFGVLSSDAEGRRLLEAAQRRFAEETGLAFLLCRGRNRGATVTARAQAASIA